MPLRHLPPGVERPAQPRRRRPSDETECVRDRFAPSPTSDRRDSDRRTGGQPAERPAPPTAEPGATPGRRSSDVREAPPDKATALRRARPNKVSSDAADGAEQKQLRAQGRGPDRDRRGARSAGRSSGRLRDCASPGRTPSCRTCCRRSGTTSRSGSRRTRAFPAGDCRNNTGLTDGDPGAGRGAWRPSSTTTSCRRSRRSSRSRRRATAASSRTRLRRTLGRPRRWRSELLHRRREHHRRTGQQRP